MSHLKCARSLAQRPKHPNDVRQALENLKFEAIARNDPHAEEGQQPTLRYQSKRATRLFVSKDGRCLQSRLVNRHRVFVLGVNRKRVTCQSPSSFCIGGQSPESESCSLRLHSENRKPGRDATRGELFAETHTHICRHISIHTPSHTVAHTHTPATIHSDTHSHAHTHAPARPHRRRQPEMNTCMRVLAKTKPDHSETTRRRVVLSDCMAPIA